MVVHALLQFPVVPTRNPRVGGLFPVSPTRAVSNVGGPDFWGVGSDTPATTTTLPRDRLREEPDPKEVVAEKTRQCRRQRSNRRDARGDALYARSD